MKKIRSDRMVDERDFDSVIDSAIRVMRKYSDGLQPDIRAEIAVEEAAADMGLIVDDDTISRITEMVIDRVYAGRRDFIAGYLAASLSNGIDRVM